MALRHKVFVSGLPPDIQAGSEHIVAEFFKKNYGEVQSVFIPKDPTKHFCFVTFISSTVAEALCEKRVINAFGKNLSVKFSNVSNPETAIMDRLLTDLENADKKTKTMVVKDGLKKNESVRLGETRTVKVTYTNRSTVPKTLGRCFFVPERPEFQFEKRMSNKGVRMESEETYTVQVLFKGERHGNYTTQLILAIDTNREIVTHQLSLTVEDPEDRATLLAEKKADRQQTTVGLVWDGKKRRLVPAFPPERASKSHMHTPVETDWRRPLPTYDIPPELQADVDWQGRFGSFDPWKLRGSLKQRMHHLLWVEEAQQVKDMRRYDLAYAKLAQVFDVTQSDGITRHRLEVPDLAERRPSVLAGDAVYVWIPGTEDVEYEGFVDKTEQASVLVMFCETFERINQSVTGGWHIRFGFNRITMRRMHMGVDETLLGLLWPETIPMLGEVEDLQKGVVLEGEDTHLNQEQREAVLRVFALGQWQPQKAGEEVGCRPAFILRGAFGTGKSRTLLGMIVQALLSDPNNHVLVCAESNSAADHILKGLVEHETLRHKLGPAPNWCLRLFAFFRNIATAPAWVQEVTYFDQSKGIFNVPPLQQLLAYRVVVSTAMNAASLHGVGVPKGHFTHILVDEASQMLEASALIPISMASPQTVVVIAGDDHQLGPKLYSPSAKHHNLDGSMVARLTKLYPSDAEAPTSVSVELVRNYRSHPLLLAFPSKHFYGGRLLACGKAADTQRLCQWKGLPKPGFPLVFVGVEGTEEQSPDSPSFFNDHEAMEVRRWVENLVKDTNLPPRRIAVVAPFYKQAGRIRALLRRTGLQEVQVGGVDNVQGREFDAVFITTVRCRRRAGQDDAQRGMGFLRDYRRLNTAITRAIGLLVCVGDPYTLSADSHWRSLMEYAKANDSYIGPTPDEEYMRKRERQEQQVLAEEAQRAQALMQQQQREMLGAQATQISTTSEQQTPQHEVAARKEAIPPPVWESDNRGDEDGWKSVPAKKKPPTTTESVQPLKEETGGVQQMENGNAPSSGYTPKTAMNIEMPPQKPAPTVNFLHRPPLLPAPGQQPPPPQAQPQISASLIQSETTVPQPVQPPPQIQPPVQSSIRAAPLARQESVTSTPPAQNGHIPQVFPSNQNTLPMNLPSQQQPMGMRAALPNMAMMGGMPGMIPGPMFMVAPGQQVAGMNVFQQPGQQFANFGPNSGIFGQIGPPPMQNGFASNSMFANPMPMGEPSNRANGDIRNFTNQGVSTPKLPTTQLNPAASPFTFGKPQSPQIALPPETKPPNSAPPPAPANGVAGSNDPDRWEPIKLTDEDGKELTGQRAKQMPQVALQCKGGFTPDLSVRTEKGGSVLVVAVSLFGFGPTPLLNIHGLLLTCRLEREPSSGTQVLTSRARPPYAEFRLLLPPHDPTSVVARVVAQKVLHVQCNLIGQPTPIRIAQEQYGAPPVTLNVYRHGPF